MLEFLGETDCAQRVRSACEAVITDDSIFNLGTEEIAAAILAGISKR